MKRNGAQRAQPDADLPWLVSVAAVELKQQSLTFFRCKIFESGEVADDKVSCKSVADDWKVQVSSWEGQAGLTWSCRRLVGTNQPATSDNLSRAASEHPS